MRTNFLSPNTLILVLLLFPIAKLYSEPLQDFCIANAAGTQVVFLDGAPCINPKLATPSHFMTSVLAKAGDTSSSRFGSNVTYTNIKNLPGSNTQGLSMARIDILVNGLVPPHSHPRASEVTILLKGTLIVGFVDASGRLFAQQLRPGDSFIFPRGLVHFLYNIDLSTPALALSGFNSQNPGAQVLALAAFASNPFISDDVLKKSFMISRQEVANIRKNLSG